MLSQGMNDDVLDVCGLFAIACVSVLSFLQKQVARIHVHLTLQEMISTRVMCVPLFQEMTRNSNAMGAICAKLK